MYWRAYFPNTNGLIYVVDSSDHARLSEAQAELNTLLAEQDLQDVPPLLFCNKQDVGGALKPEEISQKFGLADKVGGREWTVKGAAHRRRKESTMASIGAASLLFRLIDLLNTSQVGRSNCQNLNRQLFELKPVVVLYKRLSCLFEFCFLLGSSSLVAKDECRRPLVGSCGLGNRAFVCKEDLYKVECWPMQGVESALLSITQRDL